MLDECSVVQLGTGDAAVHIWPALCLRVELTLFVRWRASFDVGIGNDWRCVRANRAAHVGDIVLLRWPVKLSVVPLRCECMHYAQPMPG